MKQFLCLTILISICLTSCFLLGERLFIQYTLVNFSKRTITALRFKTNYISNSELFNYYKSRENMYSPYTFYVLPDTLYNEVQFTPYTTLFNGPDSLFHLMIIDADSVNALLKKPRADSGIVKSLILKRINLTQKEFELKNQTIIYKESN